MKKLKTWQIVLMIIFYPIGICYMIYWLYQKYEANRATAQTSAPTSKFAPQKESPTRFDMSKAKVLRDFHTKVAGVTFLNADGSKRQDIIRSLPVGSDVVFRPMAMKDHPEAIGVFTTSGKQIGFLGKQLAIEMRDKYAQNPMSAVVAGINGGEEGKSLGCNLHIIIYEKQ